MVGVGIKVPIRQPAVDVMIVVHCDANLLQIGLALTAASRFSSLLNRWQQQSNQNRNDRDDDEKFD